MTAPQESFMIVAPVDRERVGALRALLATMNQRPGVVKPRVALVPFAEFEQLHFARFFVLDDPTLNDITVYGVPEPTLPMALVFLGDCDGSARGLLNEFAQRAGDGLREIFSYCSDFSTRSDLLTWMRSHQQPSAAEYVNWVGRTMRQVREEDKLHRVLADYLSDHFQELQDQGLQKTWKTLGDFVRNEEQAERLQLTPLPARFGWRVRNALHGLGVVLILILLAPLLLCYLPFFLIELRRQERSDPEITPRPDADRVAEIAAREDHDVTNSFSAIGTLKPGLFRRLTAMFLLWMLHNAGRHVYNRGHLTRVGTIHFARWVFLDNKQRLLFASNYDGSLESYMDDFINKVAWGLNAVFSNGVGYPRTDWLLFQGAKYEQKFKHFLRRHQLLTDVWYNAHPGLTALDLERNARIRAGLEKKSMTDREIEDWLRLF